MYDPELWYTCNCNSFVILYNNWKYIIVVECGVDTYFYKYIQWCVDIFYREWMRRSGRK